MGDLSCAARWGLVAAAALVGCAGKSVSSSSASDADVLEASPSDGGSVTFPDADATLPLDDSTPDAGPAEDASAGDLHAADSIDAPSDVAEDEAPAYGLPSTAPCLSGGHVLSVEGDPGSFFFTGTQTDALGSSWAVEAEEYYALFDGALIEVTPPKSADAGGAGWFLDFNTWSPMTRMQTGVVYDVATVSTADSFGYTRTCRSAGGSFRVDEFEAPDASIGGVSMLLGFTAAFAITCDGYPGVLRGCVHF